MKNETYWKISEMMFKTGSVMHCLVYLISGKISFTVFRYLVSKEVLEEEWLEYREKEPL